MRKIKTIKYFLPSQENDFITLMWSHCAKETRRGLYCGEPFFIAAQSHGQTNSGLDCRVLPPKPLPSADDRWRIPDYDQDKNCWCGSRLANTAPVCLSLDAINLLSRIVHICTSLGVLGPCFISLDLLRKPQFPFFTLAEHTNVGNTVFPFYYESLKRKWLEISTRMLIFACGTQAAGTGRTARQRSLSLLRFLLFLRCSSLALPTWAAQSKWLAAWDNSYICKKDIKAMRNNKTLCLKLVLLFYFRKEDKLFWKSFVVLCMRPDSRGARSFITIRASTPRLGYSRYIFNSSIQSL